MSPTSILRATVLGALLVGPAWAQTAAEPLPTPVQSPAPSPLRSWVRDALRSSPRLDAALAAEQAAQARLRAADRPLYNPELGLEAEDAAEDKAFIGIRQSIDWSDKRGARTGVAGGRLGAARARLLAARQGVAVELLDALARYRSSTALDEVAKRRLELMERFATLAERRRRAGDLNQVELDLARLARAEARLRKARTATAVSEALQSLAAVVGHTPASSPELALSLPELQLRDSETEAMVRRLPELRAREATVAALRQTVKLRRRETHADPTFGLRGGREGDANVAGLSVQVPLFVRNDYRAEVEAAAADLTETQRRAQDLYRRARARLASATARYRIAHAAWQEWEQGAQRSLSSQIGLLQRLWRAGELSTTDYLVQLNQAYDTRTSAIELRGDLWRAWFDWLGASGTVDRWLRLPAEPDVRG